ncbi:MAG: hypothetical protein IPK97_15525 [Ahniella sp.]|nr:hypothetical protein [Ahniella sp.]
MKPFGLLMGAALAVLAMGEGRAAGFDTGPATLDHKDLRKRHPIESDLIAKARVLFETANARFAEQAKDGAAADVQWLPDGLVMALGRNEYDFSIEPRVREIRPNYVGVGNAERWCYLRTGEQTWLCEQPGKLELGLTRVDWRGVTRIELIDEACGDSTCTRMKLSALAPVDPETPIKRRRYHADVMERGYTLSLLVGAHGAPLELMRIDRLSRLRASTLSLKFDLDAPLAPIELPQAQ